MQCQEPQKHKAITSPSDVVDLCNNADLANCKHVLRNPETLRADAHTRHTMLAVDYRSDFADNDDDVDKRSLLVDSNDFNCIWSEIVDFFKGSSVRNDVRDARNVRWAPAVRRGTR